MGGYPPHGLGPGGGGFQEQVTRRLTGKIPWWRLDGKWEYTSVEETREEAGFEMMETYIWRR